MKTLRGVAIVLALLGAAAAQAKCTAQFMELPVRMEGSRAIAEVGINGTRIPLIVDSGAFFSSLTEATATQLGLKLQSAPYGFTVTGLSGNMVSPKIAEVAHLELLGGNLPDIEFLVGGNDSGLGAMGILGRNILGAFDTEYDLAHGMIRFVIPSSDCANTNMAYWAKDMVVSEAALEREHGDRRDRTPALRTPVKVNDAEIMALLDTGATTLVSLHGAHRAGLKDADLKDAGAMFGVGQGHSRGWTAAFDSVELGGETVRHNHLRVADFESATFDMLVGIDFFLSHRVYISKKQSRMYFTYNGGPVFALNVDAKADAPAAPASGETLGADELYRRGAASLSRQDFAAALADLDRACALEPGNAGFHATRAQAHERLGHRKEALVDLDTALAIDPSLVRARLQRVTMRAGADDAAAKVADDLAVLDATLAPAANERRYLAELYEHVNQPSPAIKQLTLWISNHPDDVMLGRARNQRCWVRAELGIELDQALKDCDAAIDDDGKDGQRLDSRGWLYLRRNQPEKAKADFDRAIELRAANAWSLYGRGVANRRLGQAAAAQADLAAARKADAKIDGLVKAAGFETAN